MNLISNGQLNDKEDTLLLSIIKTVQMLESKHEIALDLLLVIGISVTGLSKADLIILFDQKTEEQESDLESLL